ALNRIVRIVLPDPDGSGSLASPVRRIEYDAAGNVLKEIDPLNHATEYAYDAINRRVSTTDALGNTASMEYDAVGNVIAGRDALNRLTRYSFDALNRPIGMDAPSADGITPHTSYRYDAVGNLIGVTDPLDHATAYAYDALNRRIRVTDALGGVTGT